MSGVGTFPQQPPPVSNRRCGSVARKYLQEERVSQICCENWIFCDDPFESEIAVSGVFRYALAAWLDVTNVVRRADPGRVSMLPQQAYEQVKILPCGKLLIKPANRKQVIARAEDLVSNKIVYEQIQIGDAVFSICRDLRPESVEHQAVGEDAGPRWIGHAGRVPSLDKALDPIRKEFIIIIKASYEKSSGGPDGVISRGRRAASRLVMNRNQTRLASSPFVEKFSRTV